MLALTRLTRLLLLALLLLLLEALLPRLDLLVAAVLEDLGALVGRQLGHVAGVRRRVEHGRLRRLRFVGERRGDRGRRRRRTGRRGARAAARAARLRARRLRSRRQVDPLERQDRLEQQRAAPRDLVPFDFQWERERRFAVGLGDDDQPARRDRRRAVQVPPAAAQHLDPVHLRVL